MEIVMRAIILAVSIVAAALAVITSAAAHPPGRPLTVEETATARAVLTARESIRGLVEARDAKGLTRLFTEDFTHTHGSAKVDGRDNRIVSLLSGDPTVELAPVDELLVRVHGTHTAILSGRSPVKSLADGKIYEFRWTQVFVNNGEHWQMAVSQATRLPPPSN